MNRLRSAINRYILASSTEEALRAENKLMSISLVPALLFVAAYNVVMLSLLKAGMGKILIITGVYAIMIAVLILADKLNISEKIKGYSLISALSLLLIIVVIIYYPLIGTVVWTISACFIVIAMVRHDIKMLVMLTFVLLGLGFYIFFKYLDAKSDLITFISLNVSFAFLFLCASVVHRIGVERFRRNQSHIKEAMIISQISAAMLTVTTDNIEDKIMSALELCGTHYRIDRCNILIRSEDEKYLENRHEWCEPSYKNLFDYMQLGSESISTFSWCMEQLSKNPLLEIVHVDELDEKITPEKKLMQAFGIKSLLAMPIVSKRRAIGFLIFQAICQSKSFHDDQKRMLMVLSHILSDAYSKIEADKELLMLALYDPLTGLPNRVLFNRTVDTALIDAETQKSNLAIMFIDIDSFKSVNDTMGHQGGDALLKQVAMRLQTNMGSEDFVARFGGDEFIVLLRDYKGNEDLALAARKIIEIFKIPIVINNQEFFVTSSAGISTYPNDGENSVTLIMNADLAMYSAKENGKNQITFCSNAMKEDVENKVKMTNQLYKAQANNELAVYYQPIISISTKKIIGLEALIRWRHPELGMINPGIFIPLAEQTGLINSIGQFVMETACRQNKRWQEMGLPSVRMAVNLSIEQFRNPNLVQTTHDVLKETNLDPEYLEFEITESIAIKESDSIVEVLENIKALGVTISIDDFGTEYSSLARIKRLPIDRIKMAMEFVHGIAVSAKDESIAKIIINLANTLGLKVVAEGIETDVQLRFLENRVCDEGQGYYFYKPMPAEEVEAIFRNSYNEDTRR